jgi:hypothetical protein
MKAKSLLLTILALLGASQAFAQNDYRGKDFWLCFPQNARSENASHLIFRIYIVGAPNTEVAIEELSTGKKIKFGLGAGGYITWDPDTLNQLIGDGISYKSIHITSNANISVVGLSHRRASTDSYAAIPTNKLGKEYIVAGYSPLVGDSKFSTQFEVIATEDSTNITATMPDGRVIKQVTLNKGQIFNYSSWAFGEMNHDLSGSFVVADKPVAFFTGHQCAQVPSSVNFCDQLIEMTSPVSSYGTIFPIGKLAEKSRYTIRVFARDDNTTVKLNDGEVAKLSHGEYYENNMLDASALVETSKPALVMQYCQSSTSDSVKMADPFMMMVAPADRFVSSVNLFTTDFDQAVKQADSAMRVSDPIIQSVKAPAEKNKGTSDNRVVHESIDMQPLVEVLQIPVPQEQIWQESGPGHWQHFANIIVPETGVKRVFDGENAIPEVSFSRIGSSKYFVAQIFLSKGIHFFNSSVPIAIYSYGYGSAGENYDSYGHLCGERLGPPPAGY